MSKLNARERRVLAAFPASPDEVSSLDIAKQTGIRPVPVFLACWVLEIKGYLLSRWEEPPLRSRLPQRLYRLKGEEDQ